MTIITCCHSHITTVISLAETSTFCLNLTESDRVVTESDLYSTGVHFFMSELEPDTVHVSWNTEFVLSFHEVTAMSTRGVSKY